MSSTNVRVAYKADAFAHDHHVWVTKVHLGLFRTTHTHKYMKILHAVVVYV